MTNVFLIIWIDYQLWDFRPNINFNFVKLNLQHSINPRKKPLMDIFTYWKGCYWISGGGGVKYKIILKEALLQIFKC